MTGNISPIQALELAVLLTMLAATLYAIWRGRKQRSTLAAYMQAYRRGDYEIALQIAEGFGERGAITRSYCFHHGSSLLQLGRLDEAETWLRQSVSLSRRDEARQSGPAEIERQIKLTALGSSTLGQLYLEQSRYDEALACFEESLRDWPDRGATHRSIAELWLRRGNVAEALKWARLAIVKEKSSKPLSKKTGDMNFAEELATLAWAVAEASKDREQVDKLLARAIPLAKIGVSTKAQVHYHAGCAYAALGDTHKSTEYFARAASIDRLGRWGRAARNRAASLMASRGEASSF